ncbi:MAG: TRAP transporter small permease subunit [Bdellovibrionota bacterium]|nr:TRAP transporter small permease subunit [Bdellovibrionota bacterium]
MSRFISFFDNLIKAYVVTVVFLILTVSVLSIVLRWFQVSLSWTEPLVRHLVFLSAFLGATLAASTSRHIAIEILEKFLEAKEEFKKIYVLQKIIAVITTVCLVFLMLSGYDFFKVEKEYGVEVFWGIHSSTLVFIIPLGFGLVLFRTFLSLFESPVNDSENIKEETV